MIYLDNTTEYSQRISIPRPIVGSGGGNPHYATLQTKDYEIHNNGLTNIRPDSGYDGISAGTISVYVNGDTSTTFEHLTVQENGEYVAGDAMAYSAVTVNVPTGPSIVTTSLTVTENGEYVSEPGEAYTGVTVNVPTGSTINNQTKSVTITENTSTTITFDAGYTGLEQVDLTINVPGSEIHNQDKSVTITQDIGQGTNYISASTVVTADTGYTGLGEVQVDVAIPCNNSQYMGTLTENKSYVLGDGIHLWREMVVDVQVPTGSSLTAITATTNGEYTAETGYDGFSAVTVDVQPVVTGLTATTNGIYNVPSGIDGYNTVKVQVPSYCPTTAVTVGLGITELPVPATSVTCYGAATFVTSWDQLSGETGITMDKWMMLDFMGLEWDNDVYPHYFQRDKCPNAVEFVQQLPHARSLTGFQGNNPHLRKMYLYDVGALETFDSIDTLAFSQLVGRNTQEVVISDYGFTSTYGTVQADFSRAFNLASNLTSVTITQKFGDGLFYKTFEGCSALTYVNLGYSVGCAMSQDCVDIFSGCTSLETIEGFRGAIEYHTIDNSTNPFYNLPALVNFEGFEYLGADFYRDPTGTHTVDLSISTGLSHTSLIKLLNSLSTVDSSVTNAQLILGPTNLAKLTASEQAIAINKNWALS